MGLEKVTTILKRATQRGYGVPAMNVFNYESIAWAIQAAEEEEMPLIIQFYPGFQEHIPMKTVVDIAKDLAQKAGVPIGIHQDHSGTCALVVRGIADGFPSVMVDGSSLPFEENAELTAQVVQYAHMLDVDVEAELGHVGSGMQADDIDNSDHFTDPAQATAFIAITGADALAIAIGNGHGNYVKTPVLDFARIAALRKAVEVPLVMHGGSDIPVDQLQKSVRCGMSKYNIATEYQRAFMQAVEAFSGGRDAHAYFYQALRQIQRPCVDFVREKIRILNPDGRTP